MADLATDAPTFPPLFTGQALDGPQDPFEKARAEALLGCDAGLVVHNISASHLRAAIVFAPEMPLRRAMAVLIACGIGYQNALGALAPPEVAVFLTWEGGILVNGAGCGRLRAAAETSDPDAEPKWIVVGVEVPLNPQAGTDPGADPARTFLSEEGCVEVAPERLLEAWVRHTLVWINRLEEDGPRALHAEWRGLAKGVGEDVELTLRGEPHAGTFVGVDEEFGMLLREGEQTRVVPLWQVLENGSEA
jgi:biotin-(acetyl-CoA carboxylase) ligase